MRKKCSRIPLLKPSAILPAGLGHLAYLGARTVVRPQWTAALGLKQWPTVHAAATAR